MASGDSQWPSVGPGDLMALSGGKVFRYFYYFVLFGSALLLQWRQLQSSTERHDVETQLTSWVARLEERLNLSADVGLATDTRRPSPQAIRVQGPSDAATPINGLRSHPSTTPNHLRNVTHMSSWSSDLASMIIWLYTKLWSRECSNPFSQIARSWLV